MTELPESIPQYQIEFASKIIESVQAQSKTMVQGVAIVIANETEMINFYLTKGAASGLKRSAHGKIIAARRQGVDTLIDPLVKPWWYPVVTFQLIRTMCCGGSFPVQGAMVVHHARGNLYVGVSGCIRAKDDLLVAKTALQAAGCSNFTKFECSLE